MRWLIVLATLGAFAQPTEQQALDAQLMELEAKLNEYGGEETDLPLKPSRAEVESQLADATAQLAVVKTSLASCRAEMDALRN